MPNINTVTRVFSDYFHPEILWKQGVIGKVKAIGAVISWVTVIIPIIMATGLFISLCASKLLKEKITDNSSLGPAEQAHELGISKLDPSLEMSKAIKRQNQLRQIDWIFDPNVVLTLEKMIADQDNPNAGYPVAGSELLLHHYLGCQKQSPEHSFGIYLGWKGTAVPGEKLHGQITYGKDFNLYPAKGQGGGPEELKNYLNNLIESYPNETPAKIIIPFTLGKPGKILHGVVLVIEPNPMNKRKAHITMVNTHGDINLTGMHEEENLILSIAKQVFNDPETITARNEKATFTGGYCGIDMVENARLLAKTSNVQEFIKQKKLPTRSPSEIAKIRKIHAAELVTVLEDVKKLQMIEFKDKFYKDLEVARKKVEQLQQKAVDPTFVSPAAT